MSIKLHGIKAVPIIYGLYAVAEIGDVPLTHTEDIEFGVTNKTLDWILRMNPAGRFPAATITDPDISPEPLNMFESAAIFRTALRIADAKAAKNKNNKKKPLYGENYFEAAQVDMWIDFAKMEVMQHAGPILAVKSGILPPEAAQAPMRIANLHESLSGLDKKLENITFLIAERFTGADIALASCLELALSVSPDFWNYKNVVRYYTTVFFTHPGFAVAQKLSDLGIGWPVEKPKEDALAGNSSGNSHSSSHSHGHHHKKKEESSKKKEGDSKKKEEKKKEEPKKGEATAAAAAEEGEEPMMEAPKPKNPLDLLPPSPFVLDAFKREYSNNKDTRNGVTKYLWENFDKDGWTMWFCDYKYNSELTKTFMTSNLCRGWFQRMDGCRKYAFGVALIVGEESKQEMRAFWIIRGTGLELPQCIRDVDDTDLFTWRQANVAADKELIADFLCWEGPKIGKEVLEGRCFK